MFRYIDGNWIDIASLIVGIVYAVLRWRKFSEAQKFISRETGIDIGNGVSFLPLFLLSTSIFSSSWLNELLTANKLILPVAGITALFAMLEDWNEMSSPSSSS